MKKLLIIIPILSILLAVTSVSAAVSLSKRLAGRLIIQVEDKGQMWYIDPKTLKAIYVNTEEDVDRLKTEFATAVSDKDLARIALKGKNNIDYYYAKKMSGKILLQSSSGKLWYVSPVGYKRYELGIGANVLTALHKQAIGISQKNFNNLPQGACSKDLWTCSAWSICEYSGKQSRSCNKVYDCPTATTPSPVTTQSCTWTPPECTSFSYSEWSECQDGMMARTVIGTEPSNCAGGKKEPLIKRCLQLKSNVMIDVDSISIGLQSTDFANYAISVMNVGKNTEVGRIVGELEYYNYYYQYKFSNLQSNSAYSYTLSLESLDRSEMVDSTVNLRTLTESRGFSGQYNKASWRDNLSGTEKSCSSCVLISPPEGDPKEFSVKWYLASTEYAIDSVPELAEAFESDSLAYHQVLLPYSEAWTVTSQTEPLEDGTYVKQLSMEANKSYYWSAEVFWKDSEGTSFQETIPFAENRTIFIQPYNP